MESALKFDLHACTDVTGFGILGHLLEVAQGCDSQIILNHADLPIYPYAMEMYEKGETTGSNGLNRKMVGRHSLQMEIALSPSAEELLYDPQTSGGLILSLPKAQADELLKELKVAGVKTAVKIGEIVDGDTGIVVS